MNLLLYVSSHVFVPLFFFFFIHSIHSSVFHSVSVPSRIQFRCAECKSTFSLSAYTFSHPFVPIYLPLYPYLLIHSFTHSTSLHSVSVPSKIQFRRIVCKSTSSQLYVSTHPSVLIFFILISLFTPSPFPLPPFIRYLFSQRFNLDILECDVTSSQPVWWCLRRKLFVVHRDLAARSLSRETLLFPFFSFFFGRKDLPSKSPQY